MMDEERAAGGVAAGESRADKVKRQAEEKQKRLARALKANLHRRKAQSRARTDVSDPGGDDTAEEESGRGGTSSRS